MKCTRPRTIYVRDPLAIHSVALPTLVPCGRCLACRINKKREWKERIYHEYNTSDNAYFVTLTYDDEHLPANEDGVPSVCKDDVQRFFKRLRRAYPNTRIRYFLNSEYGEKDNRPHYHCIIFNLPDDALRPSDNYIKGTPLCVKGKGSLSMCNRHLSDIWQCGFVTIGYITPERCGYTADYYVNKAKSPDFAEPNFNLMSRRPGIGVDYCHRSKDKLRIIGTKGLLTARGTYAPISRLYQSKIYSEEEHNERVSRFYKKLRDRHRDEVITELTHPEQVASDMEQHLQDLLKFHNNKKL